MVFNTILDAVKASFNFIMQYVSNKISLYRFCVDSMCKYTWCEYFQSYEQLKSSIRPKFRMKTSISAPVA